MEKANSEEAVIQEKTWVPKNAFEKKLDSFFSISKRGSSLLKELIGGIVTFLAMFYILPVNSELLTGWAAYSTHPDTIILYGDVTITIAEAYAAIFAATAISAGVTTLIMGIYGKLPVGLASAMGINSMIAYTVMLTMGYNLAQAMALVFIDGVLFLIISITPFRARIVKSIPKSLKIAISAGIGFFIAFIGFQDCKIIVPNSNTCVAFGDFSSPFVLTSILGIILVLILS